MSYRKLDPKEVGQSMEAKSVVYKPTLERDPMKGKYLTTEQ